MSEIIPYVPNLTSAPINPSFKDCYYNILLDKYYVYNGTQWIEGFPYVSGSEVWRLSYFVPPSENSVVLTANGSNGHHAFNLTITESNYNTISNTSDITYQLMITPIQTGWDWSGLHNKILYAIDIGDGTPRVGSINSYDGASTKILKTETITINHDVDGTKTLNIGFDITDTSGYNYTCGNASATGTFTLTPLIYTQEFYPIYSDLVTALNRQIVATDIKIEVVEPDCVYTISTGNTKADCAILKLKINDTYIPVGRIAPKIVFNHATVPDTIVANNRQLNSVYCKNTLVYVDLFTGYILEGVCEDDTIITERFRDYENLMSFMETTNLSFKKVAIVEQEEPLW